MKVSNQGILTLAILTLLLIVCVNSASSNEIEGMWLDSRGDISRELSLWNRGSGPMFLIRDGLVEEKRRMARIAPVLLHPMNTKDLNGDVIGVSLFGRVYCPEKLKVKNCWAFRISEDKRVILSGLPGNRYGTKMIATEYGDVSEISFSDANKKYGLAPMCHPSRAFVLTKRKY